MDGTRIRSVHNIGIDYCFTFAFRIDEYSASALEMAYLILGFLHPEYAHACVRYGKINTVTFFYFLTYFTNDRRCNLAI